MYASTPLLVFALLLVGCPPSEDSVAEPTPDTDDTELDSEMALDDLAWELHTEIESLVHVRWTQPVPATVHVEFRSADAEDWLATPAQELEGGQAEFLLLGIPYETEFVFRLVQDTGAEAGPITLEEQTGTTGTLPEGMPLPTVQVSVPEQYDTTGPYLLGSVDQEPGGWVHGTFWKFIIDREGRVLWAHETQDSLWTTYMQPSRDGKDILFDAFSFWGFWDGGARSEVNRMKIDGTITHTYDTPGGHHSFVEVEDEAIVWGASNWGPENLVKVDKEGNQTTVWSCSDFHFSIGAQASCMSNTLSWEPESDTFLVSFYTTNTVVQVDHASGEALRWFGEELDGSYGFDPETSAFTWQHGAYWIEENRLLTSTHRTDVPSTEAETVCREYVVDDETQTLTNVWSFGEGEGWHALTSGEATRLPNGNTLHNVGSYGAMREVTPDGTIVWAVDWRSDLLDAEERLIGRATFVTDLYAFAP